MTSKLVYKQGFGPLAPEVYRAPAPYPYRGVSVEDALAGLELLFKQDVASDAVACLVLETVQGEGGFIPMPPEFVHALRHICDRHRILYVADEVQSGVGGPAPCGRSRTSTSAGLPLVSGRPRRRLAPGGCATGKADRMDSVEPGARRGHSAAARSRRAAAAVLDALAEPLFRERAEVIGGARARAAAEDMAARHAGGQRVRGLGPMLALELEEKSGDEAKRVTVAAREQGLVLLSCGLYGNVIRLLPPLTATDEELERGLGILDAVLERH
jgi:4-aminobutyrate aminotransferase-like enzyme